MSNPPPAPGIRDTQVNQGIQFMKYQATEISAHDKRVWELCCDVPKLAKVKAYGCGVGNVIISGSGTMASAFLEGDFMNKTQFIIGLMQFMLSPYLIGYIWSLWWVYKLIMAAGKPKDHLQNACNVMLSTAEQ